METETQDPFVQALNQADKFSDPSDQIELVHSDQLDTKDLTKWFLVCPKCRFKEDALNKPDICSNCNSSLLYS